MSLKFKKPNYKIKPVVSDEVLDSKIDWQPITDKAYDGLDYLRKDTNPADWVGMSFKENINGAQLLEKYGINPTTN